MIPLGTIAASAAPAQPAGEPAPRFDPGTLFTAGRLGDWFRAETVASLFTDTAGASPVSAAGERVARWNGLGPNALHVEQTDAARRPAYQTDGTRHWLDFDTDGLDQLAFPSHPLPNVAEPFELIAGVALRGSGFFPVAIGGTSTSVGRNVGFDGTSRRFRAAKVSGSETTVALAGVSLALDTPEIVRASWDGATLRLYRGLGQVASAAGAAPPDNAPTMAFGFTTSVIRSPIRLYSAFLMNANPTVEEIEKTIHAVAETTRSFTAFAIGDSTAEAFNGGTALLDLMPITWKKNSLADPGDTTPQQRTLWQGLSVTERKEAAWVVVQLGLNDITPSTDAPTVIAGIQDIVDTIRADIGAGAKLLVAKMTPARQRYIDLFGAVDGEAVFQQWLAVNDAVAGIGPTPITGVDGRVTSHADAMSDGNGNLAAAFDTGDGIHPNDAGRQINADAWEAALIAAGVLV